MATTDHKEDPFPKELAYLIIGGLICAFIVALVLQ